MTDPVPFRQWQLAHAARHDPARHDRLVRRWFYLDLAPGMAAVTRSLRTLADALGELAQVIAPVARQLAALGTALQEADDAS